MGPNLGKNILPPNKDVNKFDTLKNVTVYSMFLSYITADELMKNVMSCKNKFSKDYNDINMYVVQPFLYIRNLSFTKGVFQDKMKIAKVVPLFKSGDDNTFNNYRPVSLSPQFSKILEKLFDKRLSAFVEKHAVLTDSEYGFRNKNSTSVALIELVQKITASNDSKKVTIGIFIDLKKAFDTIDHSVLLQKLEYYGIRGLPHAWLTSYLEKRKQYVCVNNVKSELLKVKCGAPQGSILGQKLFILYVNDISNISPVLNFILFADDTNLFCTGNNIHTVCKIVTCELNKLNCWFVVNKLSLNLSKLII